MFSIRRSDSEVVAHAYEEWGADCVNHLDGMFAFAVYDRRLDKTADAGEGARGPSEEGVLFLARDRLGIKPLYYFAPGAKFRVPGSELRVETEGANSPADHAFELETQNSKLEIVFVCFGGAHPAGERDRGAAYIASGAGKLSVVWICERTDDAG